MLRMIDIGDENQDQTSNKEESKRKLLREERPPVLGTAQLPNSQRQGNVPCVQGLGGDDTRCRKSINS